MAIVPIVMWIMLELEPSVTMTTDKRVFLGFTLFMSLTASILNYRYNVVKVKTLYRDGIPYLIRYTLFTCRWFSIKIHKVLISDTAELHDHPWDYVSIILYGGYWEHTEVMSKQYFPHNKIELKDTRKWYGPLSILIRNGNIHHRLELPEGKISVSLIFTSHKYKDWGFSTKDGYKSNKELLLY